jgi:hypothetical protein
MKPLANLTLCALTVIGSFVAQAAPLNNIVANWHIDEGRGQKILDLSGYHRNGQLGAVAGVDANDPLWVSRRFDNTALHFDGDQFVKVTSAANLEPQKLSVEAWVKVGATVATTLPYVVAKSGMGCKYAAYGLYLHEDADHAGGNVPYFYITNSDGTGYFESPVGGASIDDGQWHHLVGTYDRKAVRMYVDGVSVGTGTPATSAIGYASFTDKDLYIGDYDGGRSICTDYNGHFVGDIDEVRIWNKALTAAEVASRYQGY